VPHLLWVDAQCCLHDALPVGGVGIVCPLSIAHRREQYCWDDHDEGRRCRQLHWEGWRTSRTRTSKLMSPGRLFMSSSSPTLRGPPFKETAWMSVRGRAPCTAAVHSSSSSTSGITALNEAMEPGYSTVGIVAAEARAFTRDLEHVMRTVFLAQAPGPHGCLALCSCQGWTLL
jgi:hypothetical protein